MTDRRYVATMNVRIVVLGVLLQNIPKSANTQKKRSVKIMREILFRGKILNTNEWVYGGIVKTFHPNFESEDAASFFLRKPNCYAICENYKDIFVEQDTISQYTGLTDKNGNKIFEGDVVNFWYGDLSESPTKYQIKYNPEFAAFLCYRKGGNFVSFDPRNKNFIFEVIGNIHDNPELIAQQPKNN